jgi:predicted nucleic acid-binding protein
VKPHTHRTHPTGQLRQLSLPDAAIAASAELTGRTLLTRNAWDFEPLRVLMDVESYADDPGR